MQQSDQPASQQREALLEAAKEHVLSFVVEAVGEEDVPASVTVLVTGTQADGAKVSDSHRAALGKTYVLAYPAGSYTFEVSASSLKAMAPVPSAIRRDRTGNRRVSRGRVI